MKLTYTNFFFEMCNLYLQHTHIQVLLSLLKERLLPFPGILELSGIQDVSSR
jgi:hypothetical protein